MGWGVICEPIAPWEPILGGIMKSILLTIATLISVSAAADVETYNNSITCLASYDQNQAKLQIETVRDILVFPIDNAGDLIDAGILGAPYVLSKTGGSSDATTGLTTNTYVVPGTTTTATVIFKTGATGGSVTSVVIGSTFSAPNLAKDQMITDSIIKDGGAGFTCSTGNIVAEIPIPGLARFP